MAAAPPDRESRLAAALGWTPAEPVNARTLAVAALGMSLPAIVVGLNVLMTGSQSAQRQAKSR